MWRMVLSANNEQFSESPCLMQIKMMLKVFLLGSYFSFYIHICIYIFYLCYKFFIFSIFLFFYFSISLFFLLFYVCCALIRMIARARHFQRVDLLLYEFV